MARCGPRVLCHITLSLGSGPCPRNTLRESKGLLEAERWASAAAESRSVAEAVGSRLDALVRRGGSSDPAQDELGCVPKVAGTIPLRVHRGHDGCLGFLLALRGQV